MSKHGGPMTAKAIATRQKAKGLQKLRFYCQMCEKQCRDENGFKCHLTSEAHARQMALFGEDPAAAVAKFSDQFQAAFLDLMRVRHPASRVEAQIVYNELVADRGHVHMNATVWHTLTEFVKHLGRAGLCRVDVDDKGHWWVALAAADAAAASASAAKAKRERADAEEAAREAAALKAQMAAAARAAAAAAGGSGGGSAPPPSRELVRGEGDGPIRLGLAVGARATAAAAAGATKPAGAPKPAVFEGGSGEAGPPAGGGGEAAKPAGAAAAIMERELAARKKARLGEAGASAPPPPPPPPGDGGDDDAPWLAPGIVVKVCAPSLKGGPFYRAKGAVASVDGGGYVAHVDVPDPDGPPGATATLRVDQAHCETVLPGVGGALVVVRGPRAGERGRLAAIDEARFRASVEFEGGPPAWFEYEDICKLAPPGRRR